MLSIFNLTESDVDTSDSLASPPLISMESKGEVAQQCVTLSDGEAAALCTAAGH